MMHKEYSIKETVKIITVTKQKQKINFQIRHPENVHAVIGIAVTSNLISESAGGGLDFVDKGNTAGYLALCIPQKGDVVFGDDVKVDNNDYADIPEKAVYGLQLNIASAKERDYYFKTYYKIDKAVLEGFYEDTYSPELTGEHGEPKPYLYKIRIYLRYQVHPTIETEKK